MKIICQDNNFITGVDILKGYLAGDIEKRFSSITASAGTVDEAHLNGNHLELHYTTLNNAYMLLGNALASDKKEIDITLKKKLSDTGIMLDCARNAVIKVEQAKKMIAVSALLGFNYFELYVEDCLEVDDEPYFGYMRGRFTQTEIQELVAFSEFFGIELVPCIQTLAHMERLFFHWREYTAPVCDKRDVLLVDEPRTYQLLENLIKTCRKCFKSGRINIGMDEAFDLGLGQYLIKHGYEPRGKIIRRHLEKVIEICRKYAFKPSMWADMFYEDMQKGEYDGIPKDVELIYWNYGIVSDNNVIDTFAYMKPSGAKVSFAGGASKYCGFAPYNRYSALAIDSTIDQIAASGVDTYLLTAWGDDGAECGHFAILPTLCYFSGRNISETDEYINRICKIISNYTYDEFCMLDDANHVNANKDYREFYNPSKYLLYADVFIGVEEVAALPEYPERYAELSKRLKPLAKRNSAYNYLFKTMYALSRVLELKSYMVEELYYAYQANDRAQLATLCTKIKETTKRLSAFTAAFEKQWRTESKEFGLEIMQIRLYGEKGRLKDAAKRIEAYLNGRIEKIEELEEKKYFYPLQEGNYRGNLYNLYVANVTYGKM